MAAASDMAQVTDKMLLYQLLVKSVCVSSREYCFHADRLEMNWLQRCLGDYYPSCILGCWEKNI